MRILAIRGQNLASLARSFEVDLASGPLRGAGLFAITGPVGAGKTTLLDAMCLALFDRTPRLSNRGGAPVGDDAAARDDWLRGNDPRTLLRRDAVEGHAEVDFTGRDGKTYRARWSVRRARRRADGRVQDQEMTLHDLDRSQLVAGARKTEVLAAIEQRLGLDFAQFCRSVLLAQGEFSAFLSASADERAKLLERLTGADVYRLLSRAAHERRKSEQQRADTLQAQFAAQELLEPAARSLLERESDRLGGELEACSTAVELAQRYVTWYETASARREEEATATVALQQAMQEDSAAVLRRRRLQRLQAAQALLPHWRIVQQRQQAKVVCDDAAVVAARDADTGSAAAEAAKRLLGAELRSLFGRDLEPPPLLRELSRWEPLLRQRLASESRLTALSAEAPRLAAAQQRAAAELADAQQAAVRAETSRQEAALCMQAADTAAAAPALTTLAARRSALAARRSQVEQLAKQFAAAAAANEIARAAAALAAERSAVRDRHREGFDALIGERTRMQQALLVARQSLDHVRTAVGLASLRAQLAAGEPCPLCGSREHPFAGTPAEDVAAAERGASEAQLDFDRSVRAVTEREEQLKQAQSAVAQTTADADRALRAAAALTADWRRTVQQDGELATATDGAVRAVLERRRGECEREERELHTLDERARELLESLQKAVHAAAAAGADAAKWQAAEQQAMAEHKAAVDAAANAAAEVHNLREAVQRDLPALRAGFAGVADWEQAIVRLGADVLRRLQAAHDLDHDAAAAASGAATARAEHEQRLAAAHRAATEADQAAAALALAAHDAGMTPDDVAESARVVAQDLAAEAEALAALQRQVDERRAVLKERVEQRKRHEASARPSLDAAEAREALELARKRRDEAQQQRIEILGQLAADDRMRRQRAEIVPRLEAVQRALEVWQALDDLIGSSAGDAFAVFAQGLTLDLLLIEANRRLAELARRYRLEKNPTGELDFVVVDLDLGGSRRGLQTLSGGETFLVSLALALALATLAAPRSRVETLFLDEGFGTLDASHLETALGALDTLQATGCQVGIISHVEGIAERIGARVEVRPEGGGQSRVLLHAR